MSLADIDICNMALSHLAVSTEIQDLVNEKSKEAQACRRFYAATRDEVLGNFAWPFATSIEALAQVATNPNPEWLYSYRYPADALILRRILPATFDQFGGVVQAPIGSTLSPSPRVETRQSRVPYRIARDAAGKLVFCDLYAAIAEITFAETDPSRFAPDFAFALSLYLAFKIGPRVGGGNQFKLADRAGQYYQQTIARVMNNAVNEEQPDELPESEFIRNRS